MNTETKSMVFKKRLFKSASILALGGFLLVSGAQGVYAQTGSVVVAADPVATAIDQVEHAYTVATDWLKEQQAAWSASIAAANAYLQSQIQIMLNDNTNINQRNTSDLAVLQAYAISHLDPPGFGACTVVMSAQDADDEHRNSRKMGSAMSRGQSKRPNSATSNAQELASKCALGLLPTNTPDPDSAMYKRLFPNGCKPPANLSKIVPGADRDLSSVIDPLEYFVPNNFPVQTDGTYAPLKVSDITGSRDYSGLVAAYTFCQNITPREPVSQQGTGHATIDDLVAGARRTEEAKASVVAACYKSVADRMQFASDNNIQSDIKGLSRHQQQVNRCEDDHASNIINDTAWGNCQTDGRSDLQADHDEAYRLGANSAYFSKTLSSFTPETREMLTAFAWSAEEQFNQRLQEEQSSLMSLISATKGVTPPTSSSLGQATQ